MKREIVDALRLDRPPMLARARGERLRFKSLFGAPAPAPTVKPPPPLPDPYGPEQMEARKKAAAAAMNSGGRTSTQLTNAGTTIGGGAFAGSKLGGA